MLRQKWQANHSFPNSTGSPSHFRNHRTNFGDACLENVSVAVEIQLVCSPAKLHSVTRFVRVGPPFFGTEDVAAFQTALPLRHNSSNPLLHPALEKLQINEIVANVKRDLLLEDDFSGVEEGPIRVLRLGAVGQCSCSGNASGGLATFDDGSTPLAFRELGTTVF